MKKLINIKAKAGIVALMLSYIFSTGYAQDGAKLFKQNCAACHKVDKASIGPQLKGAKTKWSDAGEGELIYEWVLNPTELFNSGKSQMAKDIWEFNPSVMTPLGHLSTEEIDAIFTYVDSDEAIAPEPVAENPAEGGEEEVAEAKPLTFGEKAIIAIIILMLIITIQVTSKARKALEGETETVVKAPSLAKSLTGAVEIENEASILLDHDYDGIKELDNDLPPWWLWMFYATIIFGFGYVAIYHVMDSAPLQAEAYEIEMETAKKDVEAYKLSAGMAIDENNVELLTDEAALKSGKELYSNNCVSCHGQNAEGTIRPNLTDEYWLYGGDVKQVFATVKYGKLDKGMPSHEGIYNPLELQNVVSYILSLPYAEGKEPQGDKE